MDSKSTDSNTIAFLQGVSVPVIWNSTNSGPWVAPWVNVDVYNSMPDRFILTDPDLQFNPHLPSDFIEQMCAIADRYRCSKLGFALDISDFKEMYQSIYCEGRTIYEQECQFWKHRVTDDQYEIYNAETDTTFALHDKNGDQSIRIRIAGRFTAKHIPWYVKNTIYSRDELNTVYSNTSAISTTGRMIIRSDI